MADTLLTGVGLFSAGANGREDRLAAHDRAGGSLDLGDSYGYRAAHGAARKGRVGSLRLLHGKGADMNIRDNSGWTPLMTAADEGHLDVVRYLAEEAGCDIADSAREILLSLQAG